jgi:chitinase
MPSQTTSSYCVNGDPIGNTMPCQQGFGSCEIFPAPSCGTGSGTTSKRTIGYYQASNTRQRLCNRISPSQIVSNGYTHLYFAFASIDPSSFSIVPSDPADVALYTEFTALKSRGLGTWIAIGGFDFSDATAATHTTW